jgi:hypothetical protein
MTYSAICFAIWHNVSQDEARTGTNKLPAIAAPKSDHPRTAGSRQMSSLTLPIATGSKQQLRSNLRLIVQNDVQQGAVDFNVAVVINKAQLPKSVHEKAHARSRRADHFGQRFLTDFRDDWLRPTFLPKICKEKEKSGEALFARIEQLIDQVLLDTTVASQEVRDK